MLSTILGALTGFGGTAITGAIDYFKDKEANKIKHKQMEMHMDMIKQGHEVDMQKFYARANDDEHSRLINHDIAMQEDRGFFAGLRKSVRPLITYAFFGLFVTVEVTMIQHALNSGTDFLVAIKHVWNDETQAIFAAIISFWFGSRALEKARNRV